MVVEVNLNQLKQSVLELSRLMKIPENPEAFIKEFLRLYETDQRKALLLILRIKDDQLDVAHDFLYGITVPKFVDFFRQFLNKRARLQTKKYLEKALANLEQAKVALQEQIAQIESGEEIKFVIKRK